MTFISCFLSGVFNESVVNGLQYYKKPGWIETSKWVKYNLTLWKIQNVKTTSQGRLIINIFDFVDYYRCEFW